MTPERRAEIKSMLYADFGRSAACDAIRDCLREIDILTKRDWMHGQQIEHVNAVAERVRKETARECWEIACHSGSRAWDEIRKRFGPFAPKDQREDAAVSRVHCRSDAETRDPQSSSHPSAAAQVLTHNGVGNSDRPALAADRAISKVLATIDEWTPVDRLFDKLVGRKELMQFARLAMREQARIDAEIASATICDTHLPTGVRIYGNKAADAIRKAAGIE